MKKYNFNDLQSINDDILVIYQGGGYDGCIWEYNAFIIKDNKFYDIISSGSMGIEKSEQIERELKDNTYDIYLLSDIDKFISDYNKYIAYNVVKVINDLNLDYIEFPCSDCNTLHDINEITFFESDYRREKPICSECYCLNTCGYCGSEVTIDEQINIINNDYNIEIYGCEYCIQKQVESKINRLIKDNIFIIGNKKSINVKNKIEYLLSELEKINAEV